MRVSPYDSYTPSGSSSRTSINRVLHRRSRRSSSSKETSIRSPQGSISNFSFHSATAANDKDQHDYDTSNTSSISDHKYFHSLEKPTFGFRNQSLSTLGTIRGPKSERTSTALSTPRSSQAIAPTLIRDSSPSPVYAIPPSPSSGDGDSQPFATTEISTAVTPTIQLEGYQEPLSNFNIHAVATADYKDPFIPPRQAHSLSSSHNAPTPSRSRVHKSYDFSSLAPTSRHETVVEPHKPSRQSIQEHQEHISNVNIHAAAAPNYKDPFVPSRQVHPPPSSHNVPKPSRSRDHDSSIPVSHHKSRNSHHKQPPRSRGRSVSTAPTTIHKAESNPFSTASTAPLDSLPEEPYSDSQSFISAGSSTAVTVGSFSLPPRDRMGTVSRSRSGAVTAKKKGMLGFMTDFLNSNKRPKISTPYDNVHLTHVGFNSSTGEFTGLPKEWQQLLQDSGISKSDQEKNPLAVMEIVKFYQEGGGDVWDKMGHAPASGRSRSPPIPGTLQAAFPVLSKSVDDSFIPTVGVFSRPLQPPSDNSKWPTLPTPKKAHSSGPVAERRAPQPPSAQQQQSEAVASLTKSAGATPRRREKKKEDKANGADIVKRLQQICTDADPTRLYRNLVKIGQG
jgi:hypothetical protein